MVKINLLSSIKHVLDSLSGRKHSSIFIRLFSKISLDIQLTRVLVEFSAKLFLLFAFARAVLPPLAAICEENDEKPLRQEISKCRHTMVPWANSLNTMVRFKSLYPLPLENYLLCSWKGPTTHNKAAGSAWIHALSQSESKQLKTFAP